MKKFQLLRRGFAQVSNTHNNGNFFNPLEELQKELQVPFFSADQLPFRPSPAHFTRAKEIFSDTTGRGVTLLKCVVSPKDRPVGTLPEVAFMGFSNVGKSSLIQALFRECKGVRVLTSKKPGHTRTVNYFRVKNDFVLVDMPGYGLNQPAAFAEAVGGYLHDRTRLREAILIINPEDQLRPEDRQIIDQLESLHIPYTMVITKIDLSRPSRILKTVGSIKSLIDSRRSSENLFPQPFVMSKTGTGIPYFQAFIAYLCEAL